MLVTARFANIWRTSRGCDHGQQTFETRDPVRTLDHKLTRERIDESRVVPAPPQSQSAKRTKRAVARAADKAVTGAKAKVGSKTRHAQQEER